jgi:hypothetical protein
MSPKEHSLTEKRHARLKLCLEGVNTALLENKKARAIAVSCVEWFNEHQDALLTFLRTVRRQEAFSLRIVDWTTTNYSKRHRITIYHDGLPIDLHNDYRRFLGVFTKKYFDPFARRERLTLHLHPDKQTLTTTVGQLNFMRWMLQRQVHTKVQALKKEIELDMREYDGKRHDPGCSEERFLVYSGPFRLLF